MNPWLLGLVVGNVLVLVWALVSPLLSVLLLAGFEAGWLVLYAMVFRAMRRELFAAKLELSTIRPGERADAQAARASQQELARQTEIAKRNGGVYLPESAWGADANAIFEQQREDMDFWSRR